MKRSSDVVISLAGLAGVAPLMLAIALWIKLDSPGPVFFRQQRLGKGGRLFWMYKFRTMIDGAQPVLRADGSCVVLENDARITRVGRFLRKGLDELPQLINVLRGDMSLVGPRPDEPRHLPYYTPEERRKLTVRPGITGLPQISGRRNIRWKDRILLDLYYIDHHSLALDLKILVKTFGVIFRERGCEGEDGVPTSGL